MVAKVTNIKYGGAMIEPIVRIQHTNHQLKTIANHQMVGLIFGFSLTKTLGIYSEVIAKRSLKKHEFK